MQARVGIGQVRPGKMHELVERLEGTVYSVYREQKGFSGAVLLTNADTGKVMSISMWDSAADLNAGEESTAKQRAALAELFAAQRMRETYEVTIEAGAPIHR
jgi:heme-degrading monooxygenase HmoA